MTEYTFVDRLGETQQVIVCDEHAVDMALVNDDTVTARPADDDVECEFCAEKGF